MKFWLNFQTAYDLRVEPKEVDAVIESLPAGSKSTDRPKQETVVRR